jgi:hypothetical protein
MGKAMKGREEMAADPHFAKRCRLANIVTDVVRGVYRNDFTEAGGRRLLCELIREAGGRKYVRPLLDYGDIRDIRALRLDLTSFGIMDEN